MNWSELHDAYGTASEVELLLERFVSTGGDDVAAALGSRLVHQGWRFSATLAALEWLAKRCRADESLVGRCIGLMHLLGTGDLASIYPEYDFSSVDSPAVLASAARCEPAEVAIMSSRLCVAFARIVVRVYPSIADCDGRINALQFMCCFIDDRELVRKAVEWSLRSEDPRERLAAMCIMSLIGEVIDVERSASTAFSVVHAGLRYEVAFNDYAELHVPVMGGAWEIALIAGCALGGNLRLLSELVSTQLEDWRNDYYVVCLKRQNLIC